MQFKAVIKDAKVSKSGVSIRVLASDDCSIDDLRMYMDDPVMIDVNLIAPDAEYAADGFELDGE